MSYRLFLLLSILALLVPAMGCSSDGEGDGDGQCRPGQTFRDGRCVNITPPGDRGGDTGEDAGTDNGGDTDGDGDGPSTDNGDPGVSTLPIACEPGVIYCSDPVTIAECDTAGTGHASEDACEDGRVCRDRGAGEVSCILGSADRCDPGEFVSCAGTTSYTRCGANGFPDDGNPVACPTSSPNCFSGLGCTDAICAPGATQCEGNQVRQCNAEGTDTELVRDCPSGCLGGACIDPCQDDGKGSYVGCDFYAVHLDNFPSSCGGGLGDCRALDAVCQGGTCTYTSPSTNRFGVTVSNVTTQNVQVTVYDGSNTQILSESIGPNALSNLQIAVPPGISSGSRIDNAAYRIESTGAITVHQFNPPNNVGAFSNDASLLLPKNGLGEEYIVLGWPTIGSGGNFLRSYVAVVAVQEGSTNVTIQSSVPIAAGGSVPAIAANNPTTVALEQGQVLHLYTTDQNNADLSGTRITADQAIAAFAGNQCANVPATTRFCDHMEQQLYPTETWGSDFIVAKFRPRGTEPDLIRITALNDNTELMTSPAINGVDGRTIGRGEVIQFEERRSFEVRARNSISGESAPISIAQFMVGSNYGCTDGGLFGPDCSNGAIPTQTRCNNSAIGDPSFLLNVPTRQFLTEYVFFVPSQYAENYISVIARTGTTIQLNGTALSAQPQRVTGTPFDVFHTAVQPGVNTISASRAVGLYVYGYDCDVSYAYPGGLNLEIDSSSDF